MLFDWIGANAIPLLWMIVVVVTAFAIYGSAVAIITGLSAAIATAITESSKPNEDVLKRRDERQQQYWKERHKYWKERHKHENPQCEVCKKEEETRTKVEKMMRRSLL